MKKLIVVGLLMAPALLPGTFAGAQVAADNTKSNSVNPSNHTAVADQQKNDSTDLELTKRIRQSVMDDKGLSTYAHNVKIVAVNGTVTLNGVVNSVDEKRRIGQKATAIAGAGRVVDEIKVTSSK